MTTTVLWSMTPSYAAGSVPYSTRRRLCGRREAATGERRRSRWPHTCTPMWCSAIAPRQGIDGIQTRPRSAPSPPRGAHPDPFDRDAEILGAIEAGAAGYLLKEVDPDVIIDGIQRAAAGDTVLAPDLASRVLKGMRSPLPRLTDREIDVLRLLATGSANKEIARALFVTEATVKSHLVHIFTKLGVDSRSRAIHVAQETGLI